MSSGQPSNRAAGSRMAGVQMVSPDEVAGNAAGRPTFGPGSRGKARLYCPPVVRSNGQLLHNLQHHPLSSFQLEFKLSGLAAQQLPRAQITQLWVLPRQQKLPRVVAIVVDYRHQRLLQRLVAQQPHPASGASSRAARAKDVICFTYSFLIISKAEFYFP